MSSPGAPEPQSHQFQEMPAGEEAPQERLELDDLKDVKLTITAHLGSSSMLVRDVLELKRGSVVQLDKLAGEMTDIYLNDLQFARGEVVVIADVLHVRVGEIAGGEERAFDGDGGDDGDDGGMDEA
jgi:flagellar motor switch protein FliN